MDGFNYSMNETNDGDAIDNLGFMNRSDFNGSDVDQVLFEAQDSLLGPIEQIGECQDASFLNPINDILNDISDYSKSFCDQGSVYHSLPQSQASVTNVGQPNNSWSVREIPGESASMSSYINMPDISKTTECNMVDNGYFNVNADNEQSALLPDPTVEYPAPDCSFLNNEYSNFSQWFQGLDQQQVPYLTQMPIPTSTVPSVQGFSDAFLNSIGTLPAATTITPISMEEQQYVHCPQTPAQQEVTIETRTFPDRNSNTSLQKASLFFPTSVVDNVTTFGKPDPNEIEKRFFAFGGGQNGMEWKQKGLFVPQAEGHTHNLSNIRPLSKTCGNANRNPFCSFVSPNLFQKKSVNFSPRRLSVIDLQKNRLHWAALFPRKQFIQPPEMIIMHPLRTRKLVNAKRHVVATSDSYNASINLAEYFDTSSIDIPMIRERSRLANRTEDRRKQKLQNIPGSENLTFEVQKNENHNTDNFVQTTNLTNDSCLGNLDPYPENELPELDEIFRRKKKTPSVFSAGNKRACLCQPITSGHTQKKISQSTELQVFHESSASFEEKVSMSISVRKNRSNLGCESHDLTYSSESDFGETDDEKNLSVTISGKSLKCLKCKKLFKTTRSLAIHTKRCLVEQNLSDGKVPEKQLTLSTHGVDKNIEKADVKVFTNSSIIEARDFSKLNKLHSNRNLLEHSDILTSSEEEINTRSNNSSAETKARPITRSQTRRSTRPISISRRTK